MAVRFRLAVLLAAALMAGAAMAEFPAPAKAAVKSLKITKGKPFSSGLVFVDGKFIAPPYTVERYGTVIRINGVQVTREVVAWNEFLKTQDGVKAITAEEPPAPAAAEEESPAEEPAPATDEDDEDIDNDDDDIAAEEEDDDFDDFLDELAGDFDALDGKPKKSSAKKTVAKKTEKSAKSVAKKAKPVAKKPAKPKKPQVTYELAGEFAANDTTKEYVDKINARRTEIDAALRGGGYFFFDDDKKAISGESGIAEMILAKLPEIQKGNSNFDDFMNAARSAGLVFLPDAVLRDLFRNRVDYVKLMDIRKKK